MKCRKSLRWCCVYWCYQAFIIMKFLKSQHKWSSQWPFLSDGAPSSIMHLIRICGCLKQQSCCFCNNNKTQKMFMSKNIKRNVISHVNSGLFLSWEAGRDCFHTHYVKHVWQREWVWESNGSKLEGMCERFYVCVCVFPRETIPQGSPVITLIHCPLLLYPRYVLQPHSFPPRPGGGLSGTPAPIAKQGRGVKGGTALLCETNRSSK